MFKQKPKIKINNESKEFRTRFFWLENRYFKYAIFLSLVAGAIAGGIFYSGKEETAPLNISTIKIEEKYPRLANLFFKWDISDGEAKELAKWDVVVIDMEAEVNTPENLRKIKQYNPQIKILAYITSQEFTNHFSELKSNSLRRQLYSGFSDSWWLKDSNGGRIMWWPGTWLINVTDDAPISSGERWNDYLPEFVNDKILSTGLWDGVFYDNLWENISWLPGAEDIDTNNDGKAEGSKVLDEKWQEGMDKILERTRALAGPDKIIVGNGGKDYFDYINGIAIENFQQKSLDWNKAISDYLFISGAAEKPAVTIVNSNTDNTGKKDDYKEMRFGLVSTLLGDGYYSFDYGDQAHNQLWWYDEYSNFLGKPIGSAYNIKDNSTTIKEGIWRRDFKNGIVLLNTTGVNQTISFNEEFEKIHGSQDPAYNDGSIIQSVTLDARDGVILLRHAEEEENAISAFTNGSFVRIFNEGGQSVRTGFFTYKDKFQGGEDIVIKDLDGNGTSETVVAGESQVSIWDEEGKEIVSFFPYGENYDKGINLAVGDLNKDGKAEIVTGTKRGGGPQVRIFNYQGKLINPGFFAYDKNFRGGVNVALGDLYGNGWLEIITGAGFGGGPHVRIWSGEGKLIDPGFFAYDKNFRGGVNVAAGDTDGDGKAEIITGAGFGGGPHVKVFDGKKLTLKSEFFAFDKSGRGGAEVAAVDLDQDGKTEIVASTTDVFMVTGE
jgi:hypothetical protein